MSTNEGLAERVAELELQVEALRAVAAALARMNPQAQEAVRQHCVAMAGLSSRPIAFGQAWQAIAGVVT